MNTFLLTCSAASVADCWHDSSVPERPPMYASYRPTAVCCASAPVIPRGRVGVTITDRGGAWRGEVGAGVNELAGDREIRAAVESGAAVEAEGKLLLVGSGPLW